ncbi:MAG: tRNA (cytidine(34)-2'-O)-methyltransferase [Puniceicoccales bacterium]|jgi:tRNA (cytidine/uridine-2'-O-)-methyltransferase|nr:tRNA (cytidine(34)-2'-O)-methyltransferase [Puniceicoccales bacterium]
MLHIVLHQPEIPQNTGSIGRACALTNSRLHLIHPLGFAITDAKLRRAGMDYWHSLDVRNHADWAAFRAGGEVPAERLWLLTTKAKKTIWDAEFRDGDALVFGNEGHGAPAWLHEEIGAERRIVIPQFNPILRSHNLSNAVCIVLYEALRQLRERGAGMAPVPPVVTIPEAAAHNSCP